MDKERNRGESGCTDIDLFSRIFPGHPKRDHQNGPDDDDSEGGGWTTTGGHHAG